MNFRLLVFKSVPAAVSFGPWYSQVITTSFVLLFICDDNLHARHMKQLLVFVGNVGDKFFVPSKTLLR